jgi:Domain of unknown function (DUF4267)
VHLFPIAPPHYNLYLYLYHTMTTSSQLGLTQHLLPLCSLIGVLGLWGGIYGLTNPLAFSETFGVPLASNSASANSPALPFVSFAAARNLGGGITMLALCASGNRKGAAIVLMSGVVTALADSWICSSFGGESGKAVGHAVMGLVLGGLGAGLYWT